MSGLCSSRRYHVSSTGNIWRDAFQKGCRHADEIGDNLDGYLGALQKNGQIGGEPLHCISDGVAVAFAYLTRPDSTSRKHHSRYGIAELDSVCELFGQSPRWKILADDVPTAFPEIHESSALCLFASEFDGLSPVRCMDTGEILPTYLIPLSDDEREGFFFWSREYNRIDAIWMACGELEVLAYEQLAAPLSLLARQGRDLALLVESALKIPVYYFLMRYYGRGDHEAERRCPGCGNEWRQEPPLTTPASFWDFPFRCVQCRLVSQIADAAYDDSYAHVGEFQTPSNPKSNAPGQPGENEPE